MDKQGRILLKTRKTVPGSLKQHAWTDEWVDSIDIKFDGPITPEIQARIVSAYNSYLADIERARQGGSYQAALRRPNPDRVIGVDPEKRVLLISCSCRDWC